MGSAVVEIFSHSIGCCFVQITFTVMHKLLQFMRSCLLIVDLSLYSNDVQKGFSFANEFRAILCFLSYQNQWICFYVEVFIYLELSFMQSNKYGSIWILLHTAICLTSTICWKCCLFSNVCYWLHYQISGGYRCEDLCVDRQFYSIDQHTNIMPFLLLYFCSTT